MFGFFKKKNTTASLMVNVHNALVRVILYVAALRNSGDLEDDQLEQFHLWIMDNGEAKAIYNKKGNVGFIKGEAFELQDRGIYELEIVAPLTTISIKDIGSDFSFGYGANPLWSASSEALKDLKSYNAISDSTMEKIEEKCFTLTQFLYHEGLWKFA
tara:strand:+ start:41 stop:511 length:471 start_codon:yes stop_codon:yes gene_type:complete